MKFSPNGMAIASGSVDKTIFLWQISTNKCEKYMMLNGHKNAVIELHWTQVSNISNYDMRTMNKRQFIL